MYIRWSSCGFFLEWFLVCQYPTYFYVLWLYAGEVYYSILWLYGFTQFCYWSCWHHRQLLFSTLLFFLFFLIVVRALYFLLFPFTSSTTFDICRSKCSYIIIIIVLTKLLLLLFIKYNYFLHHNTCLDSKGKICIIPHMLLG